MPEMEVDKWKLLKISDGKPDLGGIRYAGETDGQYVARRREEIRLDELRRRKKGRVRVKPTGWPMGRKGGR